MDASSSAPEPPSETTGAGPGGTSGSTSSTGSTGGSTGEPGDSSGEPGTGGEPPAGTTGGEPPDDEGTTGAPPGGPDDGKAPVKAPDADLLVALVGDMGTGSNPKAVYQRVLDEGADFLIILGDYDYADSPTTFFKDMNAVLGDGFPVFGVIGNHDVSAWGGYQAKFKERLAKIPGAVCSGDLGAASSCTYRGLHFVLSGVGTIGTKAKQEAYLKDALAADDSLWSLCLWHKNQRDLQAGDKGDEVGWEAFKICQQDGSPVMMGHEHSYARTRALTDIGNKANGHGAIGMPELIELAPGRTFTTVSGLGGKAIRAYEPSLHKADTWWATLYASNYFRQNGVEKKLVDGADHGVLFMRFTVDGDPKAAHGYLKSVGGEIIDEFDVVKK